MILFFISFIAGVLTVLAPCTISLVPVIVGGSVGGGQSWRRALVVTGSLGISVILFTLLLKVSTTFINIPEFFWQIFSGVIIVFIGFAMIFPSLWENIPFMNPLNRDSNQLLATGYKKKNVFGDILVGVALGPVFSTCSPTYFLILATVLPSNFFAGLTYLIAYAIGLCVTLLIAALAGQKILEVFGIASDPKGWIKRIVGILFILLGIFIATGLDQKIELLLAENGFVGLSGVEQQLLQQTTTMPTQESSASTTAALAALASSTTDTVARIALKNSLYPKAPEITNPSGFINTDGQPITIGQFKGKKVVLIDFWTYSCINCQRELPYVKAWYNTYASSGLEIISIHTPEFAFEKVQSNVEAAVKADGVPYPVVMDNDYGTWNAFANEYWPRTYLIDIDGYVVYNHAGEGDYDQTEAAIRKALAERSQVLGNMNATLPGISQATDTVEVDTSQAVSAETYFGSNRNEYFGNGTPGLGGLQTFTLPTTFTSGVFYLSGNWNINPEYAESEASGTSIEYTYRAKNVYFVASSVVGTRVKVLVDGKPISSAMAGTDVDTNGIMKVQENRLYNIISGSDYSTHTIEIKSLDSGLQAYTFTFG